MLGLFQLFRAPSRFGFALRSTVGPNGGCGVTTRALGVRDQELISSHHKLLWQKAHGAHGVEATGAGSLKSKTARRGRPRSLSLDGFKNPPIPPRRWQITPWDGGAKVAKCRLTAGFVRSVPESPHL